MTYIRHITLTTGFVRDSERSEIADEALAVARRLLDDTLETAAASIAAVAAVQPACWLRHSAHDGPPVGRCLALIVTTSDGTPLVTIGLAAHSRCGAPLWRRLHAGRDDLTTRAAEGPPEPWCAARLEPGLAVHPQAAIWIGDLERCLAWAWVERVQGLA